MDCATWRPAQASRRRRTGRETDRKEGTARVRARFLVRVACEAAVDMVVVYDAWAWGRVCAKGGAKRRSETCASWGEGHEGCVRPFWDEAETAWRGVGWWEGGKGVCFLPSLVLEARGVIGNGKDDDRRSLLTPHTRPPHPTENEWKPRHRSRTTGRMASSHRRRT